MRCTRGLKHLPYLLRSYHVIMCQGKEIEQIVARSYARPTQLIDMAHPDVLHPGAAGVTEVHLQASRLFCLSNLHFTTEKHEVARANSCEPTAVETCFQGSFTTAQREELAYAPVKGSLLTAYPNPGIHKCTQSHRKIDLQRDHCVLVF